MRLCHSCWRVMCSSLIPECRRTVDVDVNEPARCHTTCTGHAPIRRPLLRLRLAGEQKAQTRGLSQLGEVGAVSLPTKLAQCPCRLRARLASGLCRLLVRLARGTVTQAEDPTASEAVTMSWLHLQLLSPARWLCLPPSRSPSSAARQHAFRLALDLGSKMPD